MIKIDCNGPEGNAYYIMGVVKRVLNDNEKFKEYYEKATQSDYKNLLKVTKEYIDVEFINE